QGRLAERLQRPQRTAAVEPGRAEGVGLGEALERTAAEPAAPPQRARIRISLPSRGDEPFRIGFGKPLYLAQTQTQRISLPAIVIPAEARIQGPKVQTLALGPRLGGGDD